jgi:hypothetical protein
MSVTTCYRGQDIQYKNDERIVSLQNEIHFLSSIDENECYENNDQSVAIYGVFDGHSETGHFRVHRLI